MKNILLITTLLISINVSYSQSSSDYDKAAEIACACMEDKDISEENLELNMGLCLLEALSESKKFKNIDFNNTKQMETIGEQIGYRMGMNCPEVFMQSSEFKEILQEEIDNTKEEKLITKEMFGTIESIEDKEIVFVSLKDKNNRIYKFVWLQRFDGDTDLIKLGEKSIGRKLTIYYTEIDIFNKQLNEYLTKKQIVKIIF